MDAYYNNTDFISHQDVCSMLRGTRPIMMSIRRDTNTHTVFMKRNRATRNMDFHVNVMLMPSGISARTDMNIPNCRCDGRCDYHVATYPVGSDSPSGVIAGHTHPTHTGPRQTLQTGADRARL